MARTLHSGERAPDTDQPGDVSALAPLGRIGWAVAHPLARISDEDSIVPASLNPHDGDRGAL